MLMQGRTVRPEQRNVESYGNYEYLTSTESHKSHKLSYFEKQVKKFSYYRSRQEDIDEARNI